MSQLLPLMSSANVSFTLEPLRSGDTFLKCNLNIFQPKAKGSPPPITPTRPPECDTPRIAEIGAMGPCAYRYGAMRRCGCPTLDPEKSPELWAKYTSSVVEVVEQKIKGGAQQITLTFFASGYLLQDCQLLDSLFENPKVQSWKGTLTLQFIDLKYEIEKVQKIKNGMNQRELFLAIACGTVGIRAIFAGTNQAKKGTKRMMIGVGAALIVLAIYFGTQVAPKKGNALKGRDITQIGMDVDTKYAIQEFLHELQQRSPVEMQIQPAFYPSAQACIEKGVMSDAVLGYDIEDALPEFKQLKLAKLNKEGTAIAVIKMQKQGRDIPVFLAARGPNGRLERA